MYAEDRSTEGVNRDAEKPTVIVELNGDFFLEEDLEVSQEILEPQFRVEGEIYFTAIEEGFIGPIISGGIDIIVSRPTRDILLGLTSNALYDAFKYMVTKAKGTSTKVNIALTAVPVSIDLCVSLLE
jgi:hypothetical protein